MATKELSKEVDNDVDCESSHSQLFRCKSFIPNVWKNIFHKIDSLKYSKIILRVITLFKFMLQD